MNELLRDAILKEIKSLPNGEQVWTFKTIRGDTIEVTVSVLDLKFD